MTASPRAVRGQTPNVGPGTTQSPMAAGPHSGPVATIGAAHHDRCLGRSQQGSEEGASRCTCHAKAAQSPSDQVGADALVTRTAALGAANKAARKMLPSPSVQASVSGHRQSARSDDAVGTRPVRARAHCSRDGRRVRHALSEGCCSQRPSVSRRAPNDWR